MTDSAKYRVERDSLGEFRVPADAYYGASTRRAVENFPISELRFAHSFIKTLGLIKQSAAQVNRELGLLDVKIAAAIEKAAGEVATGKFDTHFVVDIFQTGSGTSTNMNANEIIANRAEEILGGKIGSKSLVHPNDHVNLGQSSNDVIPSAIQITIALNIKTKLLPAMDKLEQSLRVKSKQFMDVIKTGRTHLQDATPIRLGQAFLGYADQIQVCRAYLNDNLSSLAPLPLGGTAVGTGIGTHKQFASKVADKVSEQTGFKFTETPHHFKAQATIDPLVLISGSLKTFAVSLMKIANDVRWMGSGPRAGFGEIELPEVQPGSSIMPGKVNPVIAESVCMACAQVIGNDTVVAVAGQSGNFELNVMLPVAFYNVNFSVQLLAAVVNNFNDKCITGLSATDAGPNMVEKGLSLATALVPFVGYDKAAQIAKMAAKTNQTVHEVAREQTDLSEAELKQALDPFAMTKPSDK